MDIQMTKKQQTMALAGVFALIVVVLLVVNRSSLLPEPAELAPDLAIPARPALPEKIDDSVISRPDFPASADLAIPVEPGEAGVEDIFGPLHP